MQDILRAAVAGQAFKLAGRAAGSAPLAALQAEIERLMEFWAQAIEHETTGASGLKAQVPSPKPAAKKQRRIAPRKPERMSADEEALSRMFAGTA